MTIFMSPEGDSLKYKKYCIIHSCKKLASFNYHNEKIFYIVMNINWII